MDRYAYVCVCPIWYVRMLVGWMDDGVTTRQENEQKHKQKQKQKDKNSKIKKNKNEVIAKTKIEILAWTTTSTWCM